MPKHFQQQLNEVINDYEVLCAMIRYDKINGSSIITSI